MQDVHYTCESLANLAARGQDVLDFPAPFELDAPFEVLYVRLEGV